MHQNELEISYRKGMYSLKNSGIYINLDSTNIELDDILEEYNGKSWAFITAWNPGGRPLSRENNLERQIQLLLDIKDYIIMEGIGEAQDQSWSEDSFFVIDINEEEVVNLSNKYGQAAYLYGVRGEPGRLIFL